MPSDLFTLPALEDLIGLIAREGDPAHLICRSSATAADDNNPIYLESGGFVGRLEERLAGESVHIMVTNVDRYSPRIKEMVGPFFAPLRAAFEAARIDMLEPSSALFISSPGSLARLHNDMEYGFLHQVRGTKTIHVYPYVAHRVRPPNVAANQWAFRNRNSSRAYMEEFRESSMTCTMSPGEVVYIPSLAPHWVEAGDDIAVSITFLVVSGDSVRQRKIERMNRMLQALGAPQRAHGQSRWGGAVKCSLHDILTRLRLLKNR
jgi:ribosomal protein L16 Arg81 hydroxylase